MKNKKLVWGIMAGSLVLFFCCVLGAVANMLGESTSEEPTTIPTVTMEPTTLPTATTAPTTVPTSTAAPTVIIEPTAVSPACVAGTWSESFGKFLNQIGDAKHYVEVLRLSDEFDAAWKGAPYGCGFDGQLDALEMQSRFAIADLRTSIELNEGIDGKYFLSGAQAYINATTIYNSLFE